ncbi:hypothetical protein C8Q80DRAFT_185413 [Daedaleopsis nitida]|nr:hypothetical protein C8Q80DRAFT_185413 [Daedaleopsis nitida]
MIATKQLVSTLLVFLATVPVISALSLPSYRIRRQEAVSGNGTGTDKDSICPGSSPTLVTASTLTAGNATLELSKFVCALTPTAPFVLTAQNPGNASMFNMLDGLLGWLFPPLPPLFPTKTVTATATATATDVRTQTVSVSTTRTVTSVSVSVSATTGTATVTEVDSTTATATETETATSALTVVESATVTATVTATETAAAPTASPPPPVTDVCGESCTMVCGELGTLPPTSEDCQQLVNSITVLNGSIPPEFTVEPNHVQTISFGTCRFFFENVSPEPLTFCWLSLAQTASAAGDACFPPNQPVLSEGLCIPASGLWEVGAAHS